MKEAFDSISKLLILFGWQRLGVPLEIAQWLVALDTTGFTIVRTPYALTSWYLEGLHDIKDIVFNSERGTGKGTSIVPSHGKQLLTSSCVCSNGCAEHHFRLRRPDGSQYDARDICYADDRQSFGTTLDLVSTYALVFNMTIATICARFTFLRSFPAPSGACAALCSYIEVGTSPHRFQNQWYHSRSLGMEYHINPGDSTLLSLMKTRLVIYIRAISIVHH